jgi:uncharacterized protein YndB with AHSA1/START domain
VERKPSGKAKLTLPSDTEILIVRDFNARKDLVFDAWCKPDWIAQWYGCAEQKMTVCEMDFCEGGAWRWALRDERGVEHAFSGNYRVIDRPNKLEFTERYEAIPGSDHVTALTFEERAGVTTMSMRIIHNSKEARDGHLKAGMEWGIQDSLDRMEEIVTGASTKPREHAATAR